MDVAVTAHADFPLFRRQYPRDPAEFAFDLFLGKPALAVEHHGYFRNGYEALKTFVKRLNELDKRLEWSNLATICSRACLKRVTADGDVQVRFYTSRFRLANDGTQNRTYLLLRRRTSEGPVPAVTVNGHQWACELQGESLKIRLSLDPGQTADVRISPKDATGPAPVSWKPTTAHKARVFIRRTLCEVRDNHVATNPLLFALMSRARALGARERA
jgi:hypothetical protein